MDGSSSARYGRRLSASKVPVAPQSLHVSAVDLERQRRIIERSHDPKRREALQKLLTASKAGKQHRETKADGASQVPVRPSAPPVPVVVPQLPVTPVLEAQAQYDDSRKLNRAVMWEELLKTQATKAEEADKAMAAATVARLRELGKQQKRQARAIDRSRRKAEYVERNADKLWVDAVTAQHQKDVEKSKELKAARQCEIKSVLLTQAEMKAAAVAAETEAKLREEQVELEHAKSADKLMEGVDGKRKAYLKSMQRHNLAVARAQHSKSKRPEVIAEADPLVVETEQRDAERKHALQSALARIDSVVSRADYVNSVVAKKDEVVAKFAAKGDVDDNTAAMLDALLKQREDSKKAMLAKGLELQVREKELKRRIAEQERLSEQARLRQEAALVDAIHLQRKEAEALRKLVHVEELEAQKRSQATFKAFGNDKSGIGVSDAEWRMNRGFLEPRDKPRPPSPPSDPATVTAKAPLPVSTLLPALPSIAPMLLGGATNRAFGQSYLMPAMTTGGAQGWSGRLASTTSGRITTPLGQPTPLTSNASAPSLLPTAATSTNRDMSSSYVDEPDAYFGRRAVRWYD